MNNATVCVHVEGNAQSVREALLELLGTGAAQTITSSPEAVAQPAGDTEPTVIPEQTEEAIKPKRSRRTKAEMEAAKEAGNAAPATAVVVVEHVQEPIVITQAEAEQNVTEDEIYQEYLHIASQGIATRLAAVRPLDAGLLKRLRDELADGAPLLTCTDEQFANILVAANTRMPD